jgi:hypothetical protein
MCNHAKLVTGDFIRRYIVYSTIDQNLYPVKTSVSPWLFCVVVAQTQRSYYNRVKMIYKDGFSLISYLLKMMN